MNEIQMPKKVEFILDQLNQNGYEAYIVGGCVRDRLLGRMPGDWDITTSAKPLQVKQIFRRTLDTGIAHGTVTVMLGKQGFEVTTYRIDGEYLDNRHPKSVEFTENLSQDLARRDFTINAMAYSPRTGVVDLYGGMEDLKKGIIRCVGKPQERFCEDALRILRAVRFAAQLNFEIDPATQEAIIQEVELLQKISAERIRVELVKLLTSPAPQKIHTASELGITRVVLPEYEEHKKDEPHLLRALLQVQADADLRLTILFHEYGVVQTKAVMRRLKFDNHSIDRVSRLVKWFDLEYETSPAGVRRALNCVGDDIFAELIQVQRAYLSTFDTELNEQNKQNEQNFKSSKQKVQELKDLDQKERIYQQVLEEGDCYCIKMLAIGGQDLMDIGIPKGKQIGEMLNQLTQMVIEDPKLNTREQLLEIARKQMR